MAKFFVYPFAEAGDVVAIPNPTQGSGVMSYQSGFPINYEYDLSTNPAAYPIPRTQFNQLMLDITTAIQQYQTRGTPDWITSSDNLGTPYPYAIFARVQYNAGGGMQIYENQVADNVATPGADDTWLVVSGDSTGVPSGTIIDFAGGTVPSGYLLTTGAAVSRTTYATLFAAIGTTWGVGDGTTTFNIPNLARHVKMGSGGSGTAIIGNTVGSTGGEEAHTQTTGELGTHTHAFSLVGGQDIAGSGINDVTLLGSNQGTTAAAGSLAIADTGASTPFNVIQPSAVVLMCIKI